MIAKIKQKVLHWFHSRWRQQPLLPTNERGTSETAINNFLSSAIASEGSDPTLLDRARSQWQFGDWASLADISVESIEHHPDRAKLALLSAAGHQQLANYPAARKMVGYAKTWGCDQKLVARILIGGVYNTLGKAAAAAKNETRALKFFGAAVTGAGGDERLLVQARSVREVARMGLLPQAAESVQRQLNLLTNQRIAGTSVSPENSPEFTILKSQLGILQYELSLAQQRSQLNIKLPSNKPPSESSQSFSGTNAIPSPAWLATLKQKSVSQLGQDLWVLERTRYKRNGYFVEFGATDGVLLSNTFLLEKEFGWTGICIEPNPKYLAELQANRNCHVSNSCIGAVTGDYVDFVFADEFGGMLKHAFNDQHADTRNAFSTVAQNRTKLQTRSLNDILISFGAPKAIDYISVDTEGSELEILSTFPFDQWNVNLFTVEHNFSQQRTEIQNLFERAGYEHVEMKWDDWYLKK